jgi:O-succinylbenzoic acid--CoA ligase
MVVEGWLHRAARTRPGATGVEYPGGSRSYVELHAAARAGARALSGRGVTPGDRVAIALAPGLAFAETFHACLLLGAVVVPVDVRLGAAERALVCDGAVLIVDEPLEETHEQAETLALGTRHDLDAVAAVIHTSGTTSSPRPVELTYGNFLWSALGSAVALDRDPRERWLCALPVSHIGGLSILVRSAIYATTAVIHERFDTALVLHALRERDITLVSLVATTLARLLDAGLERPRTLRCALTGGGPVPEALIERAGDASVPVSTTYGLTEACSQVTTMPAGRGSPTMNDLKKEDGERARVRTRVVTVSESISPGEALSSRPHAGPPLFCTRVHIAKDGEIMVSGPTVAPSSRDRDGWLRTGDLGSLDEHGSLRVTGRVADTIVSGGENVAPAEVEAVLESHPDVLEAAVLGRPDPRWGEAVTAIVVPRPGSEFQAEALRAHCAAHLARYKVPKQVDFTGTPLPRTRSGKLLRRELS